MTNKNTHDLVGDLSLRQKVKLYFAGAASALKMQLDACDKGLSLPYSSIENIHARSVRDVNDLDLLMELRRNAEENTEDDRAFLHTLQDKVNCPLPDVSDADFEWFVEQVIAPQIAETYLKAELFDARIKEIMAGDINSNSTIKWQKRAQETKRKFSDAALEARNTPSRDRLVNWYLCILRERVGILETDLKELQERQYAEENKAS